MPIRFARRPAGPALAFLWLASATAAAADEAALERQLELLKQQNEELSRAVRELRAEVGQARDDARAARDAADAGARS
ncbi:MAG TPA: hypothetical protein VHQ66_15365, partial [Myxococcota bacterium]|nr:hypothetical protein [Myxococcota bacterium]